jgi:hypothetical protein
MEKPMRWITTRIAALIAAGACLLVTAEAIGGDFLDTRITFTLGDDNFLKSAGEQIPDSPRIGIGDREDYQLIFDNLNTATTGRENQLHLVLYKKMVGIVPRLITEAAAALEFELTEGDIYDDSSYIRLAYALDPLAKGKEYIDFVGFPLDGDRLRVGYLYDLTWGGSRAFPRAASGPRPAFKVGGKYGRFSWWTGMKMIRAPTAPDESKDEQGLTITTEQQEIFYGVLGGLGAEPLPGLSVDLSGGHMQVAENPIKDVAGEAVTLSGVSARLAYSRGIPVGLSADLRLVRNDPEFLEALSRRPSYKTDGSFNWRVALEGNAIAQVLADPELFGGTTIQWAPAAALDFRFQRNYWRVNLTAVYRSLEFLLLNTPSFVPFQAFPNDADVKPQFFGAISADRHFPTIALTAGAQFGVEMPASITTELTATEVGSNAPPTVIGENTIIIRVNGRPDILPKDKDVVPLIQARLNASWYASDMLTIVAFAFITVDQNAVVLQVNPDLSRSRVFDDELRFGAALQAQARF